MEVQYEQELMDIERCLNEFNNRLGSLSRAAQAFTDPGAVKVFGSTPGDLTNLALVARTYATKLAALRYRMYKTAEYNKAYREAYGTNHPVWEAEHGADRRTDTE